jgi:hypothetical protein
MKPGRPVCLLSSAGPLLLTIWLCWSANARAAEPFTEEALARGIEYATQLYTPGYGFGVALVDLDGDDVPDLVSLGAPDGAVGLFENDGAGRFSSRTTGGGIEPLPWASGVIAGDYDGDGDLDLYISNYELPNVLLRNDGGFRFTDVTAAAGVGDPGPGTGCAWGDYNNDGWLDLYVANYDFEFGLLKANRLYRNNGDGSFQEVAQILAVAESEPTYQSIFFDYDRDGDADLYVSNDKGYGGFGRNHLYRNDAGSFTDVSAASGTGIAIDSMGVAIGDFDGNGYADIYCTNDPPGNPLLMNDGQGGFDDASSDAGVGSFAIGWGTVFFDYDNDGRLDLFVCNAGTANRLYNCGNGWPCVDVAAEMGVADEGNSYGVATADVDQDGDLDLLVQNNGDRLRLYINHEGENRHWIRFNVIGVGYDPFAVGAVVDIRVGDAHQIREIHAGGNYKSQNERTVHFGLGDAQTVDEVTVMWPGGVSRTFADHEVNRTWTLTPPESPDTPQLPSGSGVMCAPVGGAMMLAPILICVWGCSRRRGCG